MGDCVMALPAATAIRQAHPDAYVAWAVDSRCSAILDTDRLIDSVAEFPREKWKVGRWSLSTWLDQLHHYTRLRKQGFDYGIDLQGHSKTALCLRIAGPARSVSVPATDPFANLLNPRGKATLTGLHRVERNLAVLRELGEFPTPEKPMLPDVSAELAAVRHELPSRPFATICTGGGSSDKLYSADNWAAVAQTLVAEGLDVVWVGGPGDPAPAIEGTRSLVGQLGWRQTMAVVAASAVHVAGDTGTGHIAAAYGVPCATVFGPMDPVQYRPYTSQGRVLRSPDGDPSKVHPSDLAAAALELVTLRAPTVSP